MSKVNTSEILRALEAGERTLAYLNTRPAKDLTVDVVTKIHSTAFSYQVFQLRILNSRTTRSNKLDEVWDGLDMLEYMFGKYIKHYNDIDQLGCTVCKEMFPCTRNALRNHVESGNHIRRYSVNVYFNDHMNTNFMEYWKDESGECAVLKNGRFLDFDGPNGNIFCKVCCIEVEKDKMELCKHFKENCHQEMFEDVVCAITGTNSAKKCGESFTSKASQKKELNNFGSCSSKNTVYSTSNSSPSTKKSFSRKLVEARRIDKVKKTGAENFNDWLNQTSKTNSTPSKQMNLNTEPSSMSNSSPRTKKSFSRRLVEAHGIEKVLKTGAENFNDQAASTTNSTPSEQMNLNTEPSSMSNSSPRTKKSFSRRLVEAHGIEKVLKTGAENFNDQAASTTNSTPSEQMNLNTEPSSMSNSSPRTKKSFSRRLVEAHGIEKVLKTGAENFNDQAASTTNSTPSEQMNLNTEPSSMSNSSPRTKKSFSRRLVEAHGIEKVLKTGAENFNDQAASTTNSTPSEQMNLNTEPSSMSNSSPCTKKSFSRRLAELHRIEKVEKTGAENFNDPAASKTNSTPSKQIKLNTEPPLLSSSSGMASTSTSSSIRPKTGFTRKLVEAQRTEAKIKHREETSEPENSDSSSSCSTAENEPIEFGKLKNMSWINKMYSRVRRTYDYNITPVGLTGVPINILNADIEYAFGDLGDVVLVERQTSRTNVIIYIILSDRYKNILGMNLSVKIRNKEYEIINPFLYGPKC